MTVANIDPLDVLLSCIQAKELDLLQEAAIIRAFHYAADSPLAIKTMRQVKRVAWMYGDAFREWLTPSIAMQIAYNGVRAEEAKAKTFPLTGAIGKAQQEMEKILKPAIVTTYTRVGALFPNDPGSTMQTAGSPEIQMRAARLAKKNAGKMIQDITTADRNRIKKIVADGIAKGSPAQDIANEITAWVNDDQMTPERALTIARTETATALGTAAHDAFVANGSTEKRWILVPEGKVCGVCRTNAQMGKIGINDSFISGHRETPAHPNCRCVIWYNVPKTAKGGKTPAKKGKGKK
jgi:hypothetical protein